MAFGYTQLEKSAADTYLCINVVVVGLRNSGKKTLIETFTQQKPDLLGERNEIIKTVQFKEQEIEYHIWCTQGVDCDGGTCAKVYANADVIVICLSVDQSEDVDFVKYVLPMDIHEYCLSKNTVSHLLVLNKKDLYKPRKGMISVNKANTIAAGIGAYNYRCYKCCAFNQTDVKKIFEAVAEAYYKKLTRKACSIQ